MVVVPAKSQGNVRPEENEEDVHPRRIHIHWQPLSDLSRRVPGLGLPQRETPGTIHFGGRSVELPEDGTVPEEAFGVIGGSAEGDGPRIPHLRCSL